jgi:acetolactate synthase-1/2/3 large subunit
MTSQIRTGADALVRQLCELGVRTVFGYPGGQLTPIYDALTREPRLRHILARDEQAAGFMADGYARATGEAGVCLAVCGPGVFNAFTPLAAAFTDSIPLLLISGQIPVAGRGVHSGYYHENDQLTAAATLTKRRFRVEDAGDIVPELERAFATVLSQRPGPVLFEVPVDILRAPCEGQPSPGPPTVLASLPPKSPELKSLVDLISSWQKPILLVGGGVVTARAGSLLVQLAERLGAPVFTTAMGKGSIPGDHQLSAGLPWRRATSDLTEMGGLFSPLFAEADGLLAIGCRFSQLATGNWTLTLPRSSAQIDVDSAELGRHFTPTLGVRADALLALRQLLGVLPPANRPPWAKPETAREPWLLPRFDLLGPMRRALPRDAIIVADVTRLAYMMMADFPIYEPRTFLHPAGFVSMGYGIPAALGAKAALPDRPVVTVVGDGCFLMSAMELATAVQEHLPVIVVLINDSCLTLIKSIQERRYESRYLGVDLRNPDFGLLAQAFGISYWRPESDGDFEIALKEAIAGEKPGLIEIRLGSAEPR